MKLKGVDTRGRSVELELQQFVAYTDDGTPLVVAGAMGPEGGYRFAHVVDDDFAQTAELFGLDRHQIGQIHVEQAEQDTHHAPDRRTDPGQ